MWFFRTTRKTITPKPFLARGDEGLRFFGCKTRKNRCGNVIGPKPPRTKKGWPDRDDLSNDDSSSSSSGGEGFTPRLVANA